MTEYLHRTNKYSGKQAAVLLLRFLLACLLAGLFAGAIALYANRAVLKHVPKTERTVTHVTPELAEVRSYADGAQAISFRQPDGVFVGKLRFSAEEIEARPCEVHLTVECLEDGSPAVYTYEDLNPIFVGVETISINRPNIVRIFITDSPSYREICQWSQDELEAYEAGADQKAPIGYQIAGYDIDNRLQLGRYLKLFAGAAGLILALMLMFPCFFRKHPELAFLLICGLLGTSMVFSLPRQKISYDEETHLQAVLSLSRLPGRELHVDDWTMFELGINEYNNPASQPGAAEEMRELDEQLGMRCDFRTGEHTPDFYVMPNRAPAYLSMAAGLRFADHFGKTWPTALRWARMGNLLLYLLLMAAAIRVAPVGKYLLLIIGLFPQNVFMASAISYDPFIIGCLSLGYACMLRGRKFLLPMLLFFVLGCLPKAVYAPVLLMGLVVSLLPEKRIAAIESAFKKRRTVWMALACAALFLALIGAFILPTVLNPSTSGDIRGGAVSELSQIRFILGHPFAYAQILLRQMFRWRSKCWYGPDCITFLGHIVNGESADKGFYGAYVAMLLAAVLFSHLRKSAYSLSAVKRCWMLLMILFASVLVWTAMYVAFTVPGAPEIAGVQGRYFTPLMFPLYLLLSGTGDAAGMPDGTGDAPADGAAGGAEPSKKGRLLESIYPLCYYLLELSAFFWLGLTMWKFIISAFCL